MILNQSHKYDFGIIELIALRHASTRHTMQLKSKIARVLTTKRVQLHSELKS